MVDEFTRAAEIIPDTLYFCAVKREDLLVSHSKIANTDIAFTTDRTLTYEPFYADFGPLSLGQMYRFCKALEKVLQQASLCEKSVNHSCNNENHASFANRSSTTNFNASNGAITTSGSRKGKKVYYYCGHDAHRRANSAVLVRLVLFSFENKVNHTVGVVFDAHVSGRATSGDLRAL